MIDVWIVVGFAIAVLLAGRGPGTYIGSRWAKSQPPAPPTPPGAPESSRRWSKRWARRA